MSNSVPAEKQKSLSTVIKEDGCTFQHLQHSLAEMEVSTTAHSHGRSYCETEEQ